MSPDARPEIAFGPVPSRRLGRSLGVNNIPPKLCTYSCVYCQLGPTQRTTVKRLPLRAPQEVFEAVARSVRRAHDAAEPIDYITFVADGEPTLDLRLGEAIDRLRPLGRRIAVITNASLLSRRPVRKALGRADWVSVKVDAADEVTWRVVNRPDRRLAFAEIVQGLEVFAATYRGTLVTESLLVRDANDNRMHVERLARFVGSLRPAVAYLGVATRPPAADWVRRPTEVALHNAFCHFSRWVPHVELLIGYEGNAFASTGDPRADLLAIAAVHPVREDAALELLKRSDAGADLLDRMVEEGELVRLGHDEHTFYLRRFAPLLPRDPATPGAEPLAP